jgi:hypothetical protein
LVIPIGITGWVLLRGDDPAPARVAAAKEVAARTTEIAAPPAPAPLPPAPVAARDAGAVTADPLSEELLIHPAGPDAPRPDAALRPHPITEKHQRVFRENQLIGALYGAIDVEDGAGVRRLADEYRREFPDDPNQLQQGYDIIADCLEKPGPASKAAGQRYFDEERGSMLRRFVSRLCLEQ